MKLNFKFIQRSCFEGDKIDLQQAKAVLKYKPDIIIFEMPQGKSGPGTIYNHYFCANKPLDKVDKIIKSLKISAKKYPYAGSDIIVWNNIKKLWKNGINTQIYNADTPAKIRKEFYLFDKPLSAGYPAVRSDWLFWVYLYLRDSYMAKNVKIILNNYSSKKNVTVLIFLELIHWQHVKFLLTNPLPKKVWTYYFGKFKDLKQTKDIESKIKARSKVLNYYWKKIQKFY